MKAAFVMLDLETLSLNIESAPIISIGAYLMGVIETDWSSVEPNKDFWEQNNCIIKPTFYEVVNYLDQLANLDRFVSKTTMDWWESVGGDASKLLDDSKVCKTSLAQALISFGVWFNDIKIQCEEVYIFGNGAAFDNAMMDIAHRECGIPIPWNYRNSLCIRTMYAALSKKQNKESYIDVAKQTVREVTGTDFIAHNALHDAIFQASKAQLMFPIQVWVDIVNNTTTYKK